MKFKPFFLICILYFSNNIIAQETRSSFDFQFGTTNYWVQNILNNKIDYNYGHFGINYNYKVDSIYSLRIGYINGGVPENTGNPFGDYSKLKSNYNKFSLMTYKDLKNSAKGSISAGLGLSYQTSYFQCYNCNILLNYRNDLNLNLGILAEKKISKRISLIGLIETGYSVIHTQNNQNNLIVNSALGGYDVLKDASTIQLNLSVGIRYKIYKSRKSAIPIVPKNDSILVKRDTIKIIQIVEKIVKKDSIIQKAPAVSESIENKIVEIAKEINFVTNQSELLQSSILKLNELIVILLENQHLHMIISGHTDDVGSEEANLILSEKRTQSVINYLIEKGIAKDRLVGLSFGESKLKINDMSNDARSTNRRVELKVFYKQ